MIKTLLVVLSLFFFSEVTKASELSDEIDAFCLRVENTIPVVVGSRDAHLTGNPDGLSKLEHLESVKRGMDRMKSIPDKTRTRVYWFITYIYDHPELDERELRRDIGFECKAAKMDELWD